ncbi:hypothetical protein BUALT_Bualt13G0076600 [Buddleja alternifolia]|uniref:Uncharacterized protein n=1 Tax=Buddleja alternifolia TaxID=168488 RepID=A0AAV6WLA5_9LAMI|nr:hypothetical protein BUALT_Bualt13G0076600 [Buddleja alternifolia]
MSTVTDDSEALSLAEFVVFLLFIFLVFGLSLLPVYFSELWNRYCGGTETQGPAVVHNTAAQPPLRGRRNIETTFDTYIQNPTGGESGRCSICLEEYKNGQLRVTVVTW